MTLDDILPFPDQEAFLIAQVKPKDHLQVAFKFHVDPNMHQLVKVLFVVDKSEFNRTNDIDRHICTHFVREIYDVHKGESWYSWSLITFEGEEAEGDSLEYQVSRTCPEWSFGYGYSCECPIFTTSHKL